MGGITKRHKLSVTKVPADTETRDKKISEPIDTKKECKLRKCAINFIIPIVLTAVSFYLRYYRIWDNGYIIWDEAHFAKFGSFYNRHTFYHDVHPPLGKMLCGLSEYLVGYDPAQNPDYNFESGSKYPDEINYFGMRLFQVVFSSALVPICWYTCKSLKFPNSISWLISLMICLESSFIVLGKFVLLDSFLFFFTGTTFLALAKCHENRAKEGKSWIYNFWLLFLGLSIGCVCSVKWVGLFVTAVVGFYTIVDLWVKLWDSSNNFSWYKYIKFWINRIIYLIVIPFSCYLLFFKIHFSLLYLTGDGSGSMNTLFQVGFRNTDIVPQPRFVTLGNELTLRSQGMNSNLLHSHRQVYPDGSGQHQITTYGFKDSNNNWIISNSRTGSPIKGNLKNGDTIRLKHKGTVANLHSHPIAGHVTTKAWEVSGYGNEEIGDEKDDWIVEIVDQLHSSNSTYAKLYENDSTFENFIHPVSTTFRLKHKFLGCYLSTTGKSYPAWGFSQGEVVCMDAPKSGSLGSLFDTNANWNIESVLKTGYEPDPNYEYPKSNFFKDFYQLQLSMAASNNALTPDPNKHDSIASSWWEWPIMLRGIRMSNWGANFRRYYMFGNPFILWFTTLCIPIFAMILINILVKWRHQNLSLDEYSQWKLFMTAIIPLLGYVFHYVPFIIMGRVTYYHHYVPSLYFAIFMSGFCIDYLTSGFNKYARFVVLFIMNVLVIGSFILFSPTCLGMFGPVSEYSYINWFESWEFSVYKPFDKSASMLLPYLKNQYSHYRSYLW